jgi:hypothetical protein
MQASHRTWVRFYLRANLTAQETNALQRTNLVPNAPHGPGTLTKPALCTIL